MGVSQEIQEELRNGRPPEEILERLKAKGLSEVNARRFIERAQASALSSGGVPSKPAARPMTKPAVKPAVADDDEGDGTWTMVQGAFFFTLGTLGSAVTYFLARPGGRVALFYGAILWGLAAFIVGLRRWSANHGSRPFPALAVGMASHFPRSSPAGPYFKTDNSRTERREAVVQMVRDEAARRGVAAPAGEPASALDPVSRYIVVLRSGGSDPDAQREAAWRLGEMRLGAIDAVPALLTGLKSRDTRVRASSAEALMKIDGQPRSRVRGQGAHERSFEGYLGSGDGSLHGQGRRRRDQGARRSDHVCRTVVARESLRNARKPQRECEGRGPADHRAAESRGRALRPFAVRALAWKPRQGLTGSHCRP